MAGDFDWQVRGIGSSSYWCVDNGTLFRPPIATRRTIVTAPRRHGSIPTGFPPVFEEPTLVMGFSMKGECSQTILEDRSNALINILSAPGLIITRISGALTVTGAAALISFDGITNYSYKRAVLAKASFGLPGVFLRGVVTDRTSAAPTFTNWDVGGTLAAGTAPITDAIVRVTGPSTSVTVTDVLTGTGLSWTGSLTAGNYLFMDAANLQAWISATSTQWTKAGTDVSGGLSYPGAGPLQLWPILSTNDPTVRRIGVTAAQTGSNSGSLITFHAAPAYL
jgi:hypothetical protein